MAPLIQIELVPYGGFNFLSLNITPLSDGTWYAPYLLDTRVNDNYFNTQEQTEEYFNSVCRGWSQYSKLTKITTDLSHGYDISLSFTYTSKNNTNLLDPRMIELALQSEGGAELICRPRDSLASARDTEICSKEDGEIAFIQEIQRATQARGLTDVKLRLLKTNDIIKPRPRRKLFI